MTRRKVLFVGAALALAATACGGTDHSAHESGMPAATDGAMGMGGAVPGTAGDPADAVRTIEVDATDALSFKPDRIEVEAGEVVTFVIRNVGETEHEFVLGDEAYQRMHESDMREGHSMMDMQHAVSLPPGETKEITWTFTEAGQVLFGCHQPGHYDGGMVGTITVS